MTETVIIDNGFTLAGFTSGNEGIWSRNAPLDPPTSDYVRLSEKLGIQLSRFLRPYQAGGDRVETVTSEQVGSGVIKDSDFKKVDGLVTAEKGIVLSIIAADCVPVYLIDNRAEVAGLLHCGRKSAAGVLLHNAIERMKELGAVPSEIQVTIGPHICADCYEVGEEVRAEYAKAFAPKELESIFELQGESLHLSLRSAIRLKAAAEGISSQNITAINCCTCCHKEYYSYRRGDRGKQNLAYIMMKSL
ncbi:polyphenol oxidase family protein [Ruminococcus flavefaciens]|uniref:polyphenol oxidase family protein n=1 Tax=Ruminococcus flavefaciens TaxID=1265 RepID=UPI00046571BC|nr:polyphenol oxidase family protein [Ruminococcus flavefaciens]